MRPTASRWIAAFSALLMVTAADASRRPRYGGALIMALRPTVASLDPAVPAGDLTETAAKEKLAGQVFETLVEFDDTGEPRPLLATSWRFDAARKRWIFTARTGVTLHGGATWEPPGGVVVVEDSRSINAVLRDMAQPRNAIVVRGTDGELAGTGPFRLAQWEAGKAAILEAHDAYWRGRPYLDRVEVRMGRTAREQSVDLELGRADVIESSLSDVRRTQQRGGEVVLTRPAVTLALVFENPETDHLRQALAMCIDRTAIHNVLLQRHGEISGGLLPQWFSGYAFLFATTRDVAGARKIAGSPRPLQLSYEAGNSLLRSIAERIVFNAAEAGITLRPTAGPTSADLRLIAIPITDWDAKRALDEIGERLSPGPLPADAVNLYEFERRLIDSRRLVPLFHIPVAWQFSARVHGWSEAAERWRLADVWVEDRAPQ